MKRFMSDTRGEIMIESLLVFIITTILLMLVIAMFGALYQYWNVQTVANDTAAKLAQTYEYSETGSQAEMASGFIHNDHALNVRPYRYIINKEDFEEDAKNRAKEYAENELSKTLLISLGSEIHVETEIISDFFGRRHAEVTITNTFMAPFQNIFAAIGLGDMLTYTYTGYADCVDLLDYLNSVVFIERVSKYPDSASKTSSLVSGIMKLVNKIF